MKYELTPKFDSAKSFGRKAFVEQEQNEQGFGIYVLTSYETVVAKIDYSYRQAVSVYGTHSPTTLRHIKEFLQQHGFEATSKKQIEKDYMEVIR